MHYSEEFDEGVIREGYLKSLPSRIKGKYSNVSRREAAFHVIVDLWRILSDREINQNITEFVGAIVEEDNFDKPGSMVYSALNDVLSANLLEETISPSHARKIRKIVFKRDDLHGVMRGDLFQPSDGCINNPTFSMIYLGGFYPGIYQYLRNSHEAAKAKSPEEYTGWREEAYIPSSLVTTVLYETYFGFVDALPMPYSEASKQRNRALFSAQALFESRKISQFVSWQVCPINLKFEKTLIELLAASSSSQKIPRNVLKQLPYWSFSVETPSLQIGEDTVNYLQISINCERNKNDKEGSNQFLTLLVTPYSETKSGWRFITFSYDLEEETIDSHVETIKKKSHWWCCRSTYRGIFTKGKRNNNKISSTDCSIYHVKRA